MSERAVEEHPTRPAEASTRHADGPATARSLEWGAVAFAAVYAVLFVVVARERIVFPFELEWMEGGSLEHLQRVLRGQPLFVIPSLDFVPFPYPPFYYYLAALLSPLLGDGLVNLRLISALSTLGSAVLIAVLVRRETGRSTWALACAGVFLATWPASGLYFDVARIDPLFTFLTLLFLVLARIGEEQPRWGILFAGALAGFLCVMTKQTGAVVVAAIALWLAWQDSRDPGPARWRRSLGLGVPVAALVLAASLALNGLVDERFLLHIVNAQQSHDIRGWMFGWFFGRDLLGTLPVACLFLLAWAVFGRARATLPGSEARRGVGDGFYWVALASIALACFIPRAKVSGAANNLIPVHAWLAVLLGVGAARLSARVDASGNVLGRRFRILAASALLLQLALLFYVPRGFAPSAEDRAAGERLVQGIAATPGEVLIPSQGYLAGLAGKKVYAHQMPVSDYAKSGLPEASGLEEEFARAIRERRFALILDSNTAFLRSYPRGEILERHYEPAGPVFADDAVFRPISGAPIRPGLFWRPRADADTGGSSEP